MLKFVFDPFLRWKLLLSKTKPVFLDQIANSAFFATDTKKYLSDQSVEMHPRDEIRKTY